MGFVVLIAIAAIVGIAVYMYRKKQSTTSNAGDAGGLMPASETFKAEPYSGPFVEVGMQDFKARNPWFDEGELRAGRTGYLTFTPAWFAYVAWAQGVKPQALVHQVASTFPDFSLSATGVLSLDGSQRYQILPLYNEKKDTSLLIILAFMEWDAADDGPIMRGEPVGWLGRHAFPNQGLFNYAVLEHVRDGDSEEAIGVKLPSELRDVWIDISSTVPYGKELGWI